MAVRFQVVARQNKDHPPTIVVEIPNPHKPDWAGNGDCIFNIVSARAGKRVATYRNSADGGGKWFVSSLFEDEGVPLAEKPLANDGDFGFADFQEAISAAALDLERAYRREEETYSREAAVMGDAVQWLWKNAESIDADVQEGKPRVWTFTALFDNGKIKGACAENGETDKEGSQ